MVSTAKYSDNSFIDGAIDIGAQCGIACVHHRFASRSAIVARAWSAHASASIQLE